MKGLVFLSSLLLVSSVWASPTACDDGPLSAYLGAGYSCQSGNLIFSDFNYQGTGLGANVITVHPLADFDQEGFGFAGAWSASSFNGASAREDSTIIYTVRKTAGLIDSIDLSFRSVAIGTGQASVEESFCLGASISGCQNENKGMLAVTNPGAGFSNKAFFAAVGQVSISENISVVSGINGSAIINNVSNTFSSPEPLSFVLLGTGLLGIGLMRRRLARR